MPLHRCMLRHPAQNGAPHMASLLCETAPKRRMFVSEADGSAPLLGQKGRADTIAGEAAMKPETKQDEMSTDRCCWPD